MTRITASLAALLLASTSAGAQVMTPGEHFVWIWDQDGDGSVSMQEAEIRRDDIFTAFDADEDGNMSAEEFAAIDEMRIAEQESMREEMASAGMGQGMGQGNGRGAGKGMKGLAGDDIGLRMDFNDFNQDGMTSRQEFVARTATWFARMDRNGDGVITTADFGRG
jgi:hypothetical protein